jgi:hypothetical protein
MRVKDWMSEKETKEAISEQGLTVLRQLGEKKSLEEMSKHTRLGPQALGQTIARLQADGFIGPEGDLTNKGYKILEDKGNPVPS